MFIVVKWLDGRSWYLALEVGLNPGDFALDEDQAPLPQKGMEPLPNFGPFLLWPNGWMDQDGTWNKSDAKNQIRLYTA